MTGENRTTRFLRRNPFRGIQRRGVYLNFDFLNDFDATEVFIERSNRPSSPFAVREHSTGESIPHQVWKAEATERINACDDVVVLCGSLTDRALCVSAEVEIARALRKPYFLLAGYTDRNCVKPKAALPTDKLYRWSWENTLRLLDGQR